MGISETDLLAEERIVESPSWYTVKFDEPRRNELMDLQRPIRYSAFCLLC